MVLNIITIVIAFLSLLMSAVVGTVGIAKDGKKEIKDDATQLSAINIKLDTIGNDISDIKRDVRELRDDNKNHGERIVKLEQQVKTLNRKVFPYQKGEENEN